MARKTYVVLTVIGIAIGSILFAGTQNEILNWFFGTKLPEPALEFPKSGKTFYQMRLEVDDVHNSIHGNSVIATINTTSQPISELHFVLYPRLFSSQATTPATFDDYYSGFTSTTMNISSISVNGRQYSPVIDGINASIKLDEAISPKTGINVIIDWQIQVPLTRYRYGRYYTEWFCTDFYPVLVDKKFEQPAFASRLYGNPFSFNSADYEVSIIYPDNLNMYCNALMAGRQASQDGKELVIYEANSIRDFCFFLVYDYSQIEKMQNSYRIICAFPTSKNANAPLLLSTTCDIMIFYEAAFGLYPYQELTLLATPLKGIHGMEYSSLILLQNDFTGSGYEKDRQTFILAQEIAHQWWGGIVGNDQLNEPWLDEGLSIWCAYQYLTSVQNSSANYRDPLPVKGQLAPYWQQLCASQDFYASGYSGPEAFWFDLEKEIGREKLFKVLAVYAENYRYSHASTADLLAVVNYVTGSDHRAFFANWFPDQF